MKKQLLSMAMLMAMSLSASAQQLLPYQNPNLSAEARANDLLSRLTLEEKTKLMMDTSPAIARLGIPQFQWWNEALHGVGRNGFVTVFPITMHMAASWDDTLLYMFFILLDYETLTANWVRIFPKKNRPFWSALMKDVERELNNYIRGQGLVALCMGIMFCIGFTIIGFPMAIGLGILIGIMDLVPYLHTFALIPTAFLAMLKAADTGQNFWLVFGLAVLVFCVVQVITDMVVTPKIMGKAMGLNPAILLLSLSVWGALLGFLGLIVALPLTTLIIAYWQRYVTKEKPQYHEEMGKNVPISDKNEENQ